MLKKQDEKYICTRIKNSNVVINFSDQLKEPIMSAVASVLSANYGNRLKQEWDLSKNNL